MGVIFFAVLIVSLVILIYLTYTYDSWLPSIMSESKKIIVFWVSYYYYV